MRVRRHCYDKPHRCPGRVGGGWKYPKDHRVVCKHGYFALHEQRFPKLWVHRCDECGTYALPIFTKWFDPSYYSLKVSALIGELRARRTR